jgi:pyruvate dehydrogenase E2 component (dihydrolipoamide acetyltransferase)
MAEVVEMIALSPTMEEGTLAEWYVSEGEEVAEGDLLADIETDKATMEMESWYDGTILEILVEPGDAIAVGQPIAIVGEPGEDTSGLLEGDDGGDAAPEAEPAAAEPEAATEASGGADLQEPADAGAEETAEPTTATEETVSVEEGERLRASPLARRIASDKGLELARIEGSGPSGRIVKQDVERALEERDRAEPEPTPEAEAPSPTAPPEAPAPTEVVEAPDLPGEEEPLSQMRKTIADRLQASWRTAPHFALTREIDMGPAMDYRAEINEELEAAERDVSLSVNDLIVRACAIALRRYPDVNVSYQGDHLTRFDVVNVGIAVAVDGGLVTPTIRNTDQKTLSQIASESRRLAQKARDKDLQPEDYQGGTFTVSNLGMYDIDEFMAVINPPEAAILACGAVQETPVVEEGELTVGTRMKVTLSCDHRAVDGAMGAEFLAEVAELLENPVLLSV